ncbi:tetraspanin-7-like [Carassius carassius]|uniref:tetraspanin-7-like n=1 Tax=Carassius carassius TaxID=217509 RepID=UPI002868BD48|nr:tetraspanin-7-like [Carassius carassius]
MVVDKEQDGAMSFAPPYDSLPARPSPCRSKEWERELHGDQRLSSPLRAALPSVSRRPSALPGYLLSPSREYADQQQRLSLSLCSETSLAPPVPAVGAAPPCCRMVGVMPLLRLALLIFSFLFWAAGLAILTLGVWAQASVFDYMLLSTNRYPNAPIILLGTGAVVTTWGFLGCFGVAANLPYLLRAYGFFQLATLMGGLAAGLSGLFYREDIAEGFRSGLKNAVLDYGEDEGRADALDSLQRALDCCGAEGWRDWLMSVWAIQDTVYSTGGLGNDSSAVSLPDSCCMKRKGCLNRPLPESVFSDTELAGIHAHGCFRKVFSLVNDNIFHIAATVLCLAFTQVAGIALTCLLANRLSPRLRRQAP